MARRSRRPKSSMGGARPKAVVEDGDGLWVAKFNRPDEKWNHARTEHAMLVLARACGLTTAESKVVSVRRARCAAHQTLRWRQDRRGLPTRPNGERSHSC